MQNPSAGVLTKPELVNAEFYTQTCHWAVLHRHTLTHTYTRARSHAEGMLARTHVRAHLMLCSGGPAQELSSLETEEHQAQPRGNRGDADSGEVPII